MTQITEFRSAGPPLPHIPDDLSTAQFILDYNHSIRPERPEGAAWLIEDITGREIFYEELRLRTYGLANALRLKWNFSEGDVACIYSPNHIDYPVLIWAVHRLGGVVSTANPTYSAEELRYQLTSVKTTLLFVHPAVAETGYAAAKLSGIPADRVILLEQTLNSTSNSTATIPYLIAEGSTKDASFIERKMSPGEAKKKLAFLCFSSGTTGAPKAVGISHYAIIANLIQQAVALKVNDPSIPLNDKRFRPGDISTGVLPMFHIYGLMVNLHLMIFAGVTVVVTPKFDFEEFLKSIVRYRITHLWLVPPMIVLLCKHPTVKRFDLTHVRGCISAAAPLSVELAHQLAKVLPNAFIGQGYGMTETAVGVSVMPPSRKISNGSVGNLLPGVVARVLKQDGSWGRAGENGELIVTGPSMALGYVNNEQATKETFVDGWVHTGDEVTISEGGELRIVDRLKELIKVRGFQVAPAELEGHLLGHEYVVDVCVVPVLDEYSGEVPLAFVVPHASLVKKIESTDGAKKIKAELTKYVSDHKAKHKWLKGGIEFVDEIPKNSSGKLLRRVLRDKARQLQNKEKSKL